jgi:hypothetical protein
MIEFLSPGLAWAGLAGALLPVALHLIARRPPERVPFPTTRFLQPDERTTLRLRRTPSDLLLMALRAGFLLALGLGLSGPVWVGARSGTGEIVLLDRSAAGAGGRVEAVAAARERLFGEDGTLTGVLVVFDTSAAVIPPGEVEPALEALAAGSASLAPPRYAAALAALAEARSRIVAESARVTLVGVPVAEGWSAGLAPLRRAAWPGSIRWVVPATGSAAESVPDARTGEAPRAVPPRGLARVLGGGGEGRFVSAALAALGWRVAAEGDPDVAELLVMLPGAAPSDPEPLLSAARAGAVVLVLGGSPALPRALGLWSRGEEDAPVPTAGVLAFGDGFRAPDAAGRGGGGPPQGVDVPAVWEDGRAAAAVRRMGAGCVGYLDAEPEAGRLPTSAALPGVIGRLLAACPPPAPEGGVAAGLPTFSPLDAGGRSLLERPERPDAVALGLGGGAPRLDLGPWLLGLAALLVLVETARVYLPRRYS